MRTILPQRLIADIAPLRREPRYSPVQAPGEGFVLPPRGGAVNGEGVGIELFDDDGGPRARVAAAPYTVFVDAAWAWAVVEGGEGGGLAVGVFHDVPFAALGPLDVLGAYGVAEGPEGGPDSLPGWVSLRWGRGYGLDWI